MKMTTTFSPFFILCFSITLAFFCQQVKPAPLTAGFIYITSPSDFGWSFALDQGRVLLDNGDPELTTIFASNVPPEKLVEVAEGMIMRGASLIFATSPEYQKPGEELADKYPNIYVVVVDGPTAKKNLAVVQPRVVPLFFLGGILAASLTKTGKIGFIAASESASVRRSTLAMFSAAKRILPSIKLYFVNNRKFLDTRRTKKEVQILKEQYGVDIFVGRDYDMTLAQAATSLGQLVFGFPTQFPRVLYGENVFSGCDVLWIDIWKYFVLMVKNGTWIPNNNYQPASFSATLSPFSSVVNQELIATVRLWNDRISTGGWCMFNNQTLGAPYRPSNFGPDGCLLDPRNNAYNFTEGIEYLDYFTDKQLYTPVVAELGSGTSIAIMTVLSFFDLLLLLGIGLVYRFRHTLLVISTNQFFCYAVLFGSALGYSSLFFWFDQPTVTLCNLRVWFLCLGFSFVFGGLGGKTYKMWRIWTKPEIKESQQSNLVLLVCISILFLVNGVLLLALSVLEGYAPSEVYSTGLNYDQYYIQCGLNSAGQTLLALVLGFNGLVMVATALLAYLSRNVNKRYNEMPSIVISIYSILVAAAVLVLLFVIINEADPTKRSIIMTSGVMVGITFPLICIFGPKFYKLWKEVSSSNSRTGPLSSMNTSKSSQTTK